MFDIGFAELLLIGVVGLLVVGPEQLPGAVRTTLAWVNRFRRSFDQIRTEVRRELHNDEVMQKLKAESQQLEQQVRDTKQSLEQGVRALGNEATPEGVKIEPAKPSEADINPDAQSRSAPTPDATRPPEGNEDLRTPS